MVEPTPIDWDDWDGWDDEIPQKNGKIKKKNVSNHQPGISWRNREKIDNAIL